MTLDIKPLKKAAKKMKKVKRKKIFVGCPDARDLMAPACSVPKVKYK